MTAAESPYHVLPDYDDIINRLEKIRPQVLAEIERLKKALPKDWENDARLLEAVS
jgi:hypothetical protein